MGRRREEGKDNNLKSSVIVSRVRKITNKLVVVFTVECNQSVTCLKNNTSTLCTLYRVSSQMEVLKQVHSSGSDLVLSSASRLSKIWNVINYYSIIRVSLACTCTVCLQYV